LNPRPSRRSAATQRGAAAVEFALVFMAFFAIFYAVVQYGFAFLLQQSLTMAVAEGARAAVRDAADDATRRSRAQAMVVNTLSWLPDAAALAPQVDIAPCPGNAGATCASVSVAHDALVPPLGLPGLEGMPGRFAATASVQL
jgi:Flp pilus assembly protein TadG